MSKCKFFFQRRWGRGWVGILIRILYCYECDIDLECQFYDIFHFGEQKSNQSGSTRWTFPAAESEARYSYPERCCKRSVSVWLRVITMESHIRKLGDGKNNVSLRQRTPLKFYRVGYRRRWMEKIEWKYVSGVFQFVHEVYPAAFDLGWNWFFFFELTQSEVCFDSSFSPFIC